MQSHATKLLVLTLAMGAISALLAFVVIDSRLQVERAKPEKAVVGTAALPELVPGAITVESTGDGPLLRLRYGALDGSDEPLDHQLTLHQKVTVGSGDDAPTVVTDISTHAKAVGSEKDGAIFVEFVDFSLDVSADGEEVDLPAVSSLLEGMQIEVQVGARVGIADDATAPGANPQVRRMTSLLIDGLRQSHPSLPEGELGQGGSWTQRDEGEMDGVRATLVRSVTVSAVDGGQATLDVRTQLSVEGDARGSGAGTSTIVLDIESGVVERAAGEFRQTLVSDADRETVLELRYGLARGE